MAWYDFSHCSFALGGAIMAICMLLFWFLHPLTRFPIRPSKAIIILYLFYPPHHSFSAFLSDKPFLWHCCMHNACWKGHHTSWWAGSGSNSISRVACLLSLNQPGWSKGSHWEPLRPFLANIIFPGVSGVALINGITCFLHSKCHICPIPLCNPCNSSKYPIPFPCFLKQRGSWIAQNYTMKLWQPAPAQCRDMCLLPSIHLQYHPSILLWTRSSRSFGDVSFRCWHYACMHLMWGYLDTWYINPTPWKMGKEQKATN